MRSLATRAAVLGIIAAVVIQELLIPPIDKIRAETPGLIDNLPAADPSRLLLARYHRLATGFFSVQIAGALIILLASARLFAQTRHGHADKRTSPPVPRLLDLSDL